MMTRNQSYSFVTFIVLNGVCLGGTPDSIFSNNRLCDIVPDIQTTKVAILGLGDSNQLFGGNGWDAGWQFGLAQNFTMRETGLVSWLNAAQTNSPVGEGYSIYGDPTTLNQSSPTWIQSYKLSQNGIAYTPTDTISNQHGLSIFNSYWNLNDTFRFHITTFDSVLPAVFRLNARAYGTWQPIGPSVLVQTAGNQTIQHFIFDLNSIPQTTSGIEFRFCRFNQADIVGPLGFLYGRIESLSRPTGFGYTTFYGVGGASAYDCLIYLRQQTPEAITIFKQENEMSSKSQLVVLNFGLNDRNEQALSIGPSAGLLSSTPAGYTDNVEGIVQWFRENFSQSKLHFLLIASHPISTPNDSTLVAYQSQLNQLASRYPRTTACNIGAVITSTEMEQNGYYQSASDHNHLMPAAYYEIGRRISDALVAEQAAFCRGDTDFSGSVNFKDITNILVHFSDGELDIVTGLPYIDSVIDTNFDGTINFGDIGVVLANFGVCP